jgi:hypothetical protein
VAGLFLSLLLLSRSLGCPSTDTIGPTRRQIIAGTARERDASGSSDERGDGTCDVSGEGGAAPAWWEEPYSSGSSRVSDATRGGGVGASFGKKHQSGSAPEWMSAADDEGSLNRRNSRMSAGTNERFSVGGRKSSGGAAVDRRAIAGDTGYGTNGKNMKTILEVEPVVKHYALCRSHGDLTTENFPLVESHPSSSLFFHFIIGWLLLFMLCLLEVTIQNLLTYPEVLESLLNVGMGISLQQGLYSFFSLFLVPIRLTWIVLIWKVGSTQHVHNI